MSEGKKRISYGFFALTLLLIIAAGRTTKAIHSIVYNDIVYADWFVNLFEYATDILDSVKTALGYSAIAYCTHYVSKKAGTLSLLIYIGGLLLENAARFFIDYFSSAITYYGIPMVLSSLSIQFLYETIFAVAAWAIALWFLRLRNSPKQKEKGHRFTAENNARLSILLLMTASIIQLAIFYISQYIKIREMTSIELARCIGAFLSVIVIDGGIPLLLCEAAFFFLRHITREKKEPLLTASKTAAHSPQKTKSLQKKGK